MIAIRFQRSVDGIYEGLIDKLTSTRATTNESEFSGKTRMQKNAYRLSTLLPIIASLRAIVSPRILISWHIKKRPIEKSSLQIHSRRLNGTKLYGPDIMTVISKQ